MPIFPVGVKKLLARENDFHVLEAADLCQGSWR
jgi:hypothetical protein